LVVVVQVYESTAKRHVPSVLDGYNVTVFAYGEKPGFAVESERKMTPLSTLTKHPSPHHPPVVPLVPYEAHHPRTTPCLYDDIDGHGWGGDGAGSTGAGKTHTMMGSERTGEATETEAVAVSGIIPQVTVTCVYSTR
jgi:hypothetical protein